MMRVTTVLVTAAGTATALNVLRALRERKPDALALRLVGADTNPVSLIASARLCDAFHRLPPYNDPLYLAALFDTCGRERVDMLIPIMDGEVEVVAGVQDELACMGVSTLLPSPDVVAACNDKRLTYDLLRRYNVPTPATWLPAELAQLDGSTPWPVIVKPRRGVGSAEVYRADDAAELAVFLRRVEDPIVQEYLPGEEYTVDVLIDGHGRILANVPRLRIQAKAGVSTKGRTVRDAELIERTAALCVAIGLRGPANVQWRRDGERLGCFEINPRFSGGLALTIAAGTNTPLMLVRLCLGEAVAAIGFRAGMTMIRSWSEQFFYEEVNP
jgi:carbamoyl-phosphate synthase large subunit